MQNPANYAKKARKADGYGGVDEFLRFVRFFRGREKERVSSCLTAALGSTRCIKSTCFWAPVRGAQKQGGGQSRTAAVEGADLHGAERAGRWEGVRSGSAAPILDGPEEIPPPTR